MSTVKSLTLTDDVPTFQLTTQLHSLPGIATFFIFTSLNFVVSATTQAPSCTGLFSKPLLLITDSPFSGSSTGSSMSTIFPALKSGIQ